MERRGKEKFSGNFPGKAKPRLGKAGKGCGKMTTLQKNLDELIFGVFCI
jgi:hypothetical protein